MPADEPTEASPLIKPADSNPPDIGQQSREGQLPAQVLGWTQAAVRTAILVTTFLVLNALGDLMKYVSTIRLIELGLCREHYLVHDPALVDGGGNIPEHLCKTPGIQQRLAHLRGYMSALDAIVGLVLTVPYGLLVGRMGEYILAGINVIGYLLACAWFLTVCVYWSVFPTWTAVLAPLCRVIGGGSPFLYSLIYSIAAKHIPESKRSRCFFIFMAATTITSTIGALVTAALLDYGLLFMPLMLNFPIGLLCIVTLVLIRAGNSSESTLGPENEETVNSPKELSSIRQSVHMLAEALRDRNVLMLLATVPVAKAVSPIGELTWQYIPKRFGISLATASRALSISSVECLFLLVLVLPHIKNLVQARFHASSTKADLYFVQYGFLLEAFGCLVMAASQTLLVFILGVLIFALGCGTRPALQSVLAGMVSSEHIAVLFTVVAVGDAFGTATGALILNWSFGIALGWEVNLYLGFPFVVGATCFIVACAASVYVGKNAPQLRRDA